MSCGKPHEVPCTEVLARVYSYLDGEIEVNGFSQIKQHLDECGPCLREYGLEEAVKKLVHRCCASEPRRAACGPRCWSGFRRSGPSSRSPSTAPTSGVRPGARRPNHSARSLSDRPWLLPLPVVGHIDTLQRAEVSNHGADKAWGRGVAVGNAFGLLIGSYRKTSAPFRLHIAVCRVQIEYVAVQAFAQAFFRVTLSGGTRLSAYRHQQVAKVAVVCTQPGCSGYVGRVCHWPAARGSWAGSRGLRGSTLRRS